jgi:hypothetical protein
MKGFFVLTPVFFLILLFFSCNRCTDNFPHYHGGLCWSDSSPQTLSWDSALRDCRNLGGRLPTISELRTLIQNCPGAQSAGLCAVKEGGCLNSSDCESDSCRGCFRNDDGKYSVFGDTGWYWSSSTFGDHFAWRANFLRGSVDYGNRGFSDTRVRCVR